MLGKLIKHEFIALSRYFLPLYLFAIALTPVFSLLFRLGLGDNAIPLTAIMSAFGITGFVFSMIALFVASSLLIVIRFYRTTATSEAYLTFTIPAKPGQILLSKLIVSSVWQLASFMMGTITIMGMLLITGLFSPADIASGISELIKYLFIDSDASVPITLSLYALCGIIGIPAGILLFYCSIMLGQLFNEHRVIASIGMYMAITTVVQILSMIITLPLATLGSSADDMVIISSMNITIALATGLNVIIGAACYVVTAFIMKKKLNVR